MPAYPFFSRVNTKLYANACFSAKEHLLHHLNAFHIVSATQQKPVAVVPRKYLPSPSLLKRNETTAFHNVSMEQLFNMSTHVGGRNCWNCSEILKTSTVFCDHCGSLQPVNTNNNYFEIFNLKQEFDLDLALIKKKYRGLQTVLHPDKFSSKSNKEQAMSEEFSSMVNKAYATLLNPLERGLYILSLHNTSIEESSVEVDKEFLMEIMERNEEIENEADPEILNKYFTINKGKLDSLIQKTTEAFKSNDIELAKSLLREMKYYSSIDSKIKAMKQRLNIPD